MSDQPGMTDDELAAEGGTALPDKQVVSILDLNADLDLAIDAAAPIDLGVAANANVAAPIDAAVGANVLSEGSTAQALADQGALINQDVNADAVANADQDSTLEQGAAPEGADAAGTTGTTGTPTPAPPATDPAGVTGTTDPAGTTSDPVGGATDAVGGVTEGAPEVGDLADGNLLDVNVDLAADANLAAPVNGAVAANANVAAPIDAAVAANVGSVDSDATAVAQQDAIINQSIEGSAEASSNQTSDISQP